MRRYAFPMSLALFAATMAPPALAVTSFPFPPPKEDLGHYMIDSGSGLDTGCTYRSGGPLLIRLKVPATVNEKELNPDGTLKDPAKLIAKKVIGNTVKISFPVYDIDDKAVTNGYAPEIDRISFNGDFIKVLSGFNDTW